MINDFVNADLNVVSALCNSRDDARVASVHAECVLTYINRLIAATRDNSNKTFNPTLCKVRDDLLNVLSLTVSVTEKFEKTIDYIDC